MQATGEPDTLVAGDLKTAWAPKGQDIGKQWLELSYNQAVFPLEVRVHETYNPGAVIKLEARDEKGKLHVLWEGADTTEKAPAYLELKVPLKEDGAFRTDCMRLTLDTDQVSGYNEIDAVELIGSPHPQ